MTNEQPIITPEISWVLDNVSEIALGDLERATLTEAPTRELWFSLVLPELDFEIHGGTWDDPKWAWEKHPWFTSLGLTKEECHDWFDARNSHA